MAIFIVGGYFISCKSTINKEEINKEVVTEGAL